MGQAVDGSDPADGKPEAGPQDHHVCQQAPIAVGGEESERDGADAAWEVRSCPRAEEGDGDAVRGYGCHCVRTGRFCGRGERGC